MNMAAKKISLISGLAIVFWLLPNGIGIAGTLHDSDISLTDVYQSSVAWGDYNNDGDLDLVLTGFDGINRYCIIYQNSGSPGYNFTLHQSLTGVSQGSLAWGDYDRDGDLDLIVTGLPGPVSILYRNDEGIFIDSGESLVGVWLSSVAWGDWDNDGDLDLALAGYSDVPPFRHFIIYKNDPGRFTEGQNLSTTYGVQDASLAWADYDNDGDLDLAVAGKKGTGELVTEIYKNSGYPNYSLSEGQTLSGVESGSLAWGDYDNDGDLDLALMGSSDEGLILKIYQNSGPTDHILGESTSLAGVAKGSLAWGDYDNDGDLDLALCGYDGSNERFLIYRNDEGTFNPDQEPMGTNKGVQRGSLAWADRDMDGDLDIVLTGDDGSAAVSKIFSNDESQSGSNGENIIPSPPTILDCKYSNGKLTLIWSDGADNETSSGKKTPSLGLYYNLRVGTERGADDLVAARYGTPLLGNFLSRKKSESQNTLTFRVYGKGYYWSVQTIDTSLGYSWSEESSESSWSDEGVFVDTSPPPSPSVPWWVEEGEATYSTTLTVRWTQPQDDPETKIYNYHLQVKESSSKTGDPYRLILDGDVGEVLIKKVSGCKYWKYYFAQVQAQSGGGDSVWSGWSDGIRVVRLLNVSNNLIHPRTEDNEATIEYFLIRPTWVNLKIYNLAGELVNTLVDKENKTEDDHKEPWQGGNSSGEIVASGIYIVHIETEGAYATEKICVIK